MGTNGIHKSIAKATCYASTIVSNQWHEVCIKYLYMYSIYSESSKSIIIIPYDCLNSYYIYPYPIHKSIIFHRYTTSIKFTFHIIHICETPKYINYARPHTHIRQTLLMHACTHIIHNIFAILIALIAFVVRLNGIIISMLQLHYYIL